MDMPTFANDLLRGIGRAQTHDGSGRVTDFREDIVEITERDYWRLPEKARELIRAYAVEVFPHPPDVLKFRLAISRWEEIQQAMRVLPEAVKRRSDVRET